MSDAEIEETFVVGLERMYPEFSRSDVACFRVSRVSEVFAIPTLDYSKRIPPMVTSVPGVHLVTSAQIVNGTLNVNETVGLAERAARTLLGERARPQEPSIAVVPASSPGARRQRARRDALARSGQPVVVPEDPRGSIVAVLAIIPGSRGAACPAVLGGTRAADHVVPGGAGRGRR